MLRRALRIIAIRGSYCVKCPTVCKETGISQSFSCKRGYSTKISLCKSVSASTITGKYGIIMILYRRNVSTPTPKPPRDYNFNYEDGVAAGTRGMYVRR